MKLHPQLQLLLGPKMDGVIEAVHYTKTGNIDWVRAYERRGPTWSDHVLLDREALIEKLRNKKRFYLGKRVQYQAGEFEVTAKIKLVGEEGKETIVSGDTKMGKDFLESVPII